MPSYKSQYKIEQLNDNAMADLRPTAQIKQQKFNVLFEFPAIQFVNK